MNQLLLAALLSTSISSSSLPMEEPVTDRNLPEINAMWNYSKPEETRKRFEQLLLEHAEGAPRDYVLQVKTQVARTYSLTAQFEEAHRILDRVESQLSAETPIAKVRYLLERGRTYNSSGEKTLATELFIAAYSYGGSIEAHNYSVDAAHMVAISSVGLEDKLKWNRKGLDEAKKSDDPSVRRWVGTFYNNMGWDLFEAGRYDEALVEFEDCRKFYKQSENIRNFQIAQWSIAKTYRLLGRISEALEIQTTLLEEEGGTDESGYTYEELGELYLLMGESEKSKFHFAKAYDILCKDVWLQRNEAERLARLRRLST